MEQWDRTEQRETGRAGSERADLSDVLEVKGTEEPSGFSTEYYVTGFFSLGTKIIIIWGLSYALYGV